MAARATVVLVTEDREIRDRITALIEEEHRLRAAQGSGSADPGGDERDRLGRIEVELDQCWDLLRQRQARREFGDDPADSAVRPPSVVEGYQN